jgi:hypothetical protein
MFLQGVSASALPSQSGQTGKFLTTDGTDASWAAISSESIRKALPLKSGATLSAGRALNINSSGEVGDYPVVNTLGTLVENTTSTYAEGLSFFSTDGSRALIPVNAVRASGGGFPFSVRGVALTSTGQTTGSPVSLGASGGFNYVMFCKPINETQFLITYSTSSGTGPGDYGLTIYCYARVATVDASGNVTLGTANTWSQGGSTFAYGIDQRPWALPSGRFAVYAWIRYDNYEITYFSRTFSISGTTLTSTGDTDLAWESDYQSFLTSGNKLVGASGGTLYYCDYNGTTTSSYGNTNLVIGGRASTSARTILLNANYGLSAYNKSNNDFVVDTFSINQTTGVPTTTSTYVISPATTIAAGNIFFELLSSTEVVISYEIGTTSYVLSLQLNATGQVTGTGIPLVTNSVGDDVFDIKKTGTNTVRYVYNNSSKGYTRDININSYATLPWVSLGASATSQSTSPAEIVVGGICSGFTGLTAGTVYYVNEATYNGQVTSTIGRFRLGTAISSTEILLG